MTTKSVPIMLNTQSLTLGVSLALQEGILRREVTSACHNLLGIGPSGAGGSTPMTEATAPQAWLLAPPVLKKFEEAQRTERKVRRSPSQLQRQTRSHACWQVLRIMKCLAGMTCLQPSPSGLEKASQAPRDLGSRQGEQGGKVPSHTLLSGPQFPHNTEPSAGAM